MKTLTFETVLKTIKEYFLMALGMMLYSFGWIGCIMPVKGTGGGAAGLSLVLCHALEQVGIDIQIGTMVFFLNAVLLLIAGFIIGWNFGVKTIFCVVVISLGMNFWQSVLPPGDFLHLDRAGIIGITMPGFGTTDRTYNNALELMRGLGVTIREIPIRDACTQHFQDIGLDPGCRGAAYENAQARERTQILMDVANMEGGLVVGTGDLSELALGWACLLYTSQSPRDRG